jgi:hypothetical protein
MEAVLDILKQAGTEILLAVLAAVAASVGVLLRRLADLLTVQGAVERAAGIGLSAVSDATEGSPVDEGAAISLADEYLRTNVGGAAKRLGADLGAIAAASVVGAIAKAARK